MAHIKNKHKDGISKLKPKLSPRGKNAGDVDNTVSHDANYLFYAGIKMEKVDRGEPTSPQVEKNPEVTDINRPQAWLMGNGIWMYTHYGQRIEATAVAQSRGKNLAEVWPTKEQQQKFFAAIPGDAVAKNRVMYSGKDTFTGYRHPCSGELDGTDDISIWWSASSQDGDNARNVCLERGTQGAELDWFNCDFAFPLRLLSEA